MKTWRETWAAAWTALLAPGSVGRSGQRVVLGLVLLVTVLVRLRAIGVPALDRTYWKEIDYLAISSNYHAHGFAFFHPEVTWPADGPRVTAMELPLVPYVAAIGYAALGVNPFSVRWLTLLAFLVVGGYVFLLARRESGPAVGLLAAAAASFLPLHNPFGRLLYSEPAMLAASVVGLHHFAQWADGRRRRDWVLGICGFGLAVALKAEPLYLLLPLSWIAYRSRGTDPRWWRSLGVFVALSLVLPVAWYAYAWHLGRTSIDVFGVFGGHDKMQTLTMLSQPDWYRTMVVRVGYGVLGGSVGSLLAVAGLAAAALVGRGGLFVAWLAAIGCYFAIVAEGNIDADYRQLHILPVIAVFVALGAAGCVAAAAAMWSSVRGSAARPGVRAVLAGAMLLVVLIPVRRRAEVFTRDRDRPALPDAWTLAQEVRKHRTPGGRLVAVGEYTIHRGGNDLSPVLYHYAGMQGWTLQRGDWRVSRVDSLIARGATLFTASDMAREPDAAPFLREMRARHPVLFEDGARGLLLLDLRSPRR